MLTTLTSIFFFLSVLCASRASLTSEPDESKIVNINEAYSTITNGNRINNLIAILESDEVIAHIVNDKKNLRSAISNTSSNSLVLLAIYSIYLIHFGFLF